VLVLLIGPPAPAPNKFTQQTKERNMYGFIKLIGKRYAEAARELAAHDPSVRSARDLMR
jgi:hypothetical protein